ncbi:tRNA pseudouridine(13) synthase TruD [Nanoarchaeota archaeon]
MYTIKSKPEDFVVEELIDLKLDDSGGYAYFWLRKRDYNTVKAIEKVSSFIRCRVRDIGFAGNKDRCAVTKQAISIKDPQRRVDPERFSGFNRDDLNLEYIGRGKVPVSMGDLTGNRFEIVLRDCEKEPEQITWFVNYFDEQRFSETNKEVGKAIVKKDFKRACELVSNDAVTRHLDGKQNDFVGALKTLPFKTRMLLVHAYQSWLWNETVKGFLLSLCDDFYRVEYSLGEFVFPKSEVAQISVPIVGFGTELGDGKVDKMIKGLLVKEGIGVRDFVVGGMPELSAEGGARDVVVEVRGLKIEKMEEKEYRIMFSLSKGCYATMAVKRMMANP